LKRAGKIGLIVLNLKKLNDYMKNFLVRLFALSILFVSSYTFCLSQSQSCRICGSWRWEKNDERHDFLLEISIKDSLIFGRHCYILDSGNKMDCSMESTDASFKTQISVADSMTVIIRSYYSNQKGLVKLELKNKKLYWTLIKAPKGEYYLPKNAILLKDK